MVRPFNYPPTPVPEAGILSTERVATTLEHALAMALLAYLEGSKAPGRTLAECVAHFENAAFSAEEVKAAVRELGSRRLLLISVSTEHEGSPILRLAQGVTAASYTEAQDQRVY
jgi:hypothetical protein